MELVVKKGRPVDFMDKVIPAMGHKPIFTAL